VTVHLDTSALIGSLTGRRRSLDTLMALSAEGHRLAISSLVLYEWRRGPRTNEELDAQEALLPAETTVTFGVAEAALAATLYRQVRRPRGREIDLAIAASALANGAAILTLNPEDFRDVPGLKLVEV
jgi:predicted nucleic acid-binding protein